MSTLFRVLGALGRTMITAGVILLLFVAYQLWGTGLHTAQAQDELEDEYLASLSDAELDEGQAGADQAAAGDGSESARPAPQQQPGTFGDGKGLGEVFGLSETEVASLPPPAPSEPVGYISIPAIDSNWWYVEGTDLSWLRDGPGHFLGTSFPGQKGNAALAGHRTTYGAPFHRVDELIPGDEILIESAQGEFRYEVMSRGELAEDMPIDVSDPAGADEGHFIVNPDAEWILKDYDDNRITLMACHPKYSAAERIVVVGRLTGPVAPTTPRSEETDEVLETQGDDPTAAIGEDLAGGDPTARVPALLWALAAGSVWFLAWQIGRTWRRAKWPAYVLGTPVFLVVLFVCFTQVERLLPAGY